MYEAPKQDPRPICEYCGGVITEHPQRCPTLPTKDDPTREPGYCHPDPYDVSTGADRETLAALQDHDHEDVALAARVLYRHRYEES